MVQECAGVSTLRADETWGIVGRRCVAATRIVHQLKGEPPSPGCLLEIAWETGEVTLLDDGADLILSVSCTPWRDPYASCDATQLEELAAEVGLWNRQPVADGDALGSIVGEMATAVEPMLNRAMQLGGIEIRFQSVLLTAEVLTDGLLEIELRDAQLEN